MAQVRQSVKNVKVSSVDRNRKQFWRAAPCRNPTSEGCGKTAKKISRYARLVSRGKPMPGRVIPVAVSVVAIVLLKSVNKTADAPDDLEAALVGANLRTTTTSRWASCPLAPSAERWYGAMSTSCDTCDSAGRIPGRAIHRNPRTSLPGPKTRFPRRIISRRSLSGRGWAR
jgi:hypothetical protein